MQRTGLVRVPTLLKYVTFEVIMRRYGRQQEIHRARMAKASARVGREVSTQVTILDLAGLSLMPDKASMDVFLGTVKVGQVSCRPCVLSGMLSMCL